MIERSSNAGVTMIKSTNSDETTVLVMTVRASGSKRLEISQRISSARTAASAIVVAKVRADSRLGLGHLRKMKRKRRDDRDVVDEEVTGRERKSWPSVSEDDDDSWRVKAGYSLCSATVKTTAKVTTNGRDAKATAGAERHRKVLRDTECAEQAVSQSSEAGSIDPVSWMRPTST